MTKKGPLLVGSLQSIAAYIDIYNINFLVSALEDAKEELIKTLFKYSSSESK